MRRRLKDPFYNNNVASEISVSKVMYDALGIETTDSSLAVQAKYKISVLRRATQDSFLFALASSIDTRASI